MGQAKEKIIDRIKKLLRMAKDTASPNEAAIAASRARKLMDMHQVDELDLTAVEADDFGESAYSTGATTCSAVISTLGLTVGKLNDCVATWGSVGRVKHIIFKGLLADSVCASEMLKYLRDEMYKQAERNETGRANRHAYRLGFANGVSKQVAAIMADRHDIKTSTGTGLVVAKKQLVEAHYGRQRTQTTRPGYRGDRSAFLAGRQAGESASLNRQVNGQQQGRLA